MANSGSILETEVHKKLAEFEFNICEWIDKILPKKFNSYHGKFLLEAISKTDEALIYALTYDITNFPKEKLKKFEETKAGLLSIESRLNQVYFQGLMSNKYKATLDISILELHKQLSRLLTWAETKLGEYNNTHPHSSSQDPVGTLNGQ